MSDPRVSDPLMSEPLILRAITRDDAPLIARLHTESWQSAYRGILTDAFLDGALLAERERTWHERLTTGFGVGWVAMRAGEAEGFTFVRTEQHERWGLWIDNLHVRHVLKGRGTGRALLGAVAEYAASQAPERGIWLWVYADNHKARAFYRRVGGEEVETVPMLSPDGRMLPECRVAWTSARALDTGVSVRASAT